MFIGRTSLLPALHSSPSLPHHLPPSSPYRGFSPIQDALSIFPEQQHFMGKREGYTVESIYTIQQDKNFNLPFAYMSSTSFASFSLVPLGGIRARLYASHNDVKKLNRLWVGLRKLNCERSEH